MSRFFRWTLINLVTGTVLFGTQPHAGLAQSATVSAATISEEIRSLPTYPFSEPNPVPILVRDARL